MSEHYIISSVVTNGRVGWAFRVEHDRMGQLAQSPPGHTWPGPFDALAAARHAMDDVADRISRD